MDAFVGAGLVTIMVNHEAAELVANVDRLVDVATINGPDKPILSVGATTTLGAPEVTFLEMVARGDCPDRWILDLWNFLWCSGGRRWPWAMAVRSKSFSGTDFNWDFIAIFR